MSSSTCSIHDAIPPRSARRAEGGFRLFGFVGPAPPVFDDKADDRVRFDDADGVGGATAPFLSASTAATLLGPFKLVSDERVFRFNVEAAAAAEVSAGGSDGDGALLPYGVASVLESSVTFSSNIALLVEATGCGVGAFREICDRR